jgi:energy-coupling factor transporter ATP-binding protein EcfA2
MANEAKCNKNWQQLKYKPFFCQLKDTIVIAIDGPSASGKSTSAKLVAKALPVADNAKQRQEKEIVKLRYPGRRIAMWKESAKFSAIKGPFAQLKLRAVNNGRVDFEEVAGESPFIKDFKDEFKYHFYLMD